MLCPKCKIEMVVDRREEAEGGVVRLIHKCRNPRCAAYETGEKANKKQDSENE